MQTLGHELTLVAGAIRACGVNIPKEVRTWLDIVIALRVAKPVGPSIPEPDQPARGLNSPRPEGLAEVSSALRAVGIDPGPDSLTWHGLMSQVSTFAGELARQWPVRLSHDEALEARGRRAAAEMFADLNRPPAVRLSHDEADREARGKRAAAALFEMN